MHLQFLGANRQVTGSCYLLEAAGKRVLIDRGLFQERRFQERNWKEPAFDPHSIDLLLLTHGHLDHCGLIPRLVSQGFSGQIITTAPSVELASIVMRDSARIHEEDVAYKLKRHKREGKRSPHPYVPLYTVADADRAVSLLHPVDYGHPVPLGDGLVARYHDAGHILGSAMLELEVRDGSSSGRPHRIIFSGDIGQWSRPLVDDPTLFENADVVIMESTYGDREHRDEGDIEDRLAHYVSEAVEAGGNVLIPTFAIERAQELMFHLARLLRQKRIPPLPVFLDSPMAIDVVDVFAAHRDYLDDQTRAMLARGHNPFEFAGLHLCRTVDQSKAINAIRGTAIILAGSGMCTGGRIKHHLVQNIGRAESTLLFVGYQAPDTLGGIIRSGQPEVRILGHKRPVRIRIRQLHGLSAHADRTDLLRWLGSLAKPPHHLFLTHGEESVALRLADEVRSRWDWNVTVPEYQQSVKLDGR